MIKLNNKKARLSWDESDIMENEIAYRMEENAEELKAGEVTEDEIKNRVYNDSYIFNFAYDDLKESLTELMREVNAGEYWDARVNNFGWRSLDGSKVFTAKTGEELLQNILPKTDCTFYIFKRAKMLIIRNYHHDSPMGNEIYYIKPLSAKQYDKLS